MRIAESLSVGIAVAAALAVCGSSASATTVEFSEPGLPTNSPLTGSGAFAPQGIHFTGSTKLVYDSRGINAGTDTAGITTGFDNPVMGVTFDAGTNAVKFFGFATNTDFFATAYDSLGVAVDSFFDDGFVGSGDRYFSDTLTSITPLDPIVRVEFHDNNNFIFVGRLEFTPVPEPTGLIGGLSGLGVLLARRKRA